MDKMKYLVVLKGEPHDDVVSYKYDKTIQKYNIVFNTGKDYNYAYSSFELIKDPKSLDVDLYRFTNSQGKTFNNVEKVLLFSGNSGKYYRIFFSDKSSNIYKQADLVLTENILKNKQNTTYLDYYKSIANKVGIKLDDGRNILEGQFEKMSFVPIDSVLASFLTKKIGKKHTVIKKPIIFPFGSNLSQINAVNNAMNNKISIIEGPPGTGKTQTILNILANIVVSGKTVAVVSNNNSATSNVLEKLQKHGFGYISAQLGSAENKATFIEHKQTPYPNFNSDFIPLQQLTQIQDEVASLEEKLIKMYSSQNEVAVLKQELSAMTTEKQYFDEYFSTTYDDSKFFRNENKLKSKDLLQLWIKLQEVLEKGKKIRFFFKVKSLLLYGINDTKIFDKKPEETIAILKKQFYEVRIREIENDIQNRNIELENFSFKESTKEFTEKSLAIFKYTLAKKYNSFGEREHFDEDVFWKSPYEFLIEYPIVLSTTHSLRGSLKDAIYDYVIVDEASQVDLATGVLAMSVAKNMVVVGDLKQLPNVINDKDKSIITQLSDQSDIPVSYRYEEQSLLSSVCEIFDYAPKTLLKEHYRCHPKIINFCNQKFYNNELVIMTEDNNEEDVLQAIVTVKGNHARGRFNQRQVDEIKDNILPQLNSSDVGIITPYKDQVEAIDKELTEALDISTVHKYQGREKDDIIISTVDNEIGEFADNPNMLNVAVSRAKKRLRLVVSDNEKNENTNIGDLIKYIRYNSFEVKQGEVFSVFDMLYKSYEAERKKYLSNNKKVSEYDSENLMYAVITEVLSEVGFSNLDVVTHQLLNSIIRNPHKLSDKETAYAMNSLTHVDFLIYNAIDKSIILAVEVDGHAFHKQGSEQKERDELKDIILQKYDVPLIRFSSTGSNEKERLREKLCEVLG